MNNISRVRVAVRDGNLHEVEQELDNEENATVPAESPLWLLADAMVAIVAIITAIAFYMTR